MSERSKYAVNGEYKCENFAEHLAAGQFPRHYIHDIPWISVMYITLEVREESNQVYPYIAFHSKPKLKIRALFNIKSKFWSVRYKTEGGIYLESDIGVSGPSINFQDVMNEENGYLDNGTLTVEYGFHVDAILGSGNIWTFCLSSKLFNHEKESNTFNIKHRSSPDVHYSPKPLLVFHSSLVDHDSENVILQHETDDYHVKHFLQIANGVRLQAFLLTSEWLNIAEVGRMMKMMNVVHYCDSIIIRTSPSVFKNKEYLEKAIKLNMKQYVLRMLEQWNFKDLMEELRKYSDEIPGEMMKVVVARFIKEEF